VHVLALLCLCACSGGEPASRFQGSDGSVADGAGTYDAASGYDAACDPPSLVYCSETKGPVASLDAAGAGVVVECPADYPTCEPPGFEGPTWVCCFNCQNPPLASCLQRAEAGTDASEAVDGPTE
jgi:hypothetical protein